MARFLKNRQHLVDKAPGTITFVGRKKMENTRFRMISFDKSSLDEYETAGFDELFQNMHPGRVNWINIDGLHDVEVIRAIGSRFGLSALVLEDIVNTDQRPKIIEDGENIVTYLKQLSFNRESEKISADHITLILGKNYVISIQEKVGEFFSSIRSRLRENVGRARKSSSDYLYYRIMDVIFDNYMICIGEIGDIVEADEEKILTSTSKGLVENIYRHKIEVSFIRKVVRPALEITKRLKTLDNPLLKKQTLPFLDDLDDLGTQIVESVEVYFTMISDQLNIYNTNLSNSANDVMKVLTIFAAIFIPLTFIAGIYGTNFEYVPELQYRYSYFIMWGVMIAMAGVMLYFFRKKKWF